jgi:plastocyanin
MSVAGENWKQSRKGGIEMQPNHRKFGYAIALLATVGFGTMAGRGVHGLSQKDSAAATEIKIDNFAFAPGAVTVARATTIQWVNRDDIPHTVVSVDKSTFKSKALDTDDKFSYPFQKPGTYTYLCSLHPKMTAKIVVQ